MRVSALQRGQGRRDSNSQPPVLETGALPIAPRPSVAVGVYRRGAALPRVYLGVWGDRALLRDLRTVDPRPRRRGPRPLDGVARHGGIKENALLARILSQWRWRTL